MVATQHRSVLRTALQQTALFAFQLETGKQRVLYATWPCSAGVVISLWKFENVHSTYLRLFCVDVSSMEQQRLCCLDITLLCSNVQCSLALQDHTSCHDAAVAKHDSGHNVFSC